MPDYMSNGCNYGMAFRQFCGEPNRTGEKGGKLSPGHLRTPLRTTRIADAVVGRGAWSTLYLPPDRRINAIKRLYRSEKAIAALHDAGMNMGRGVQDFIVALSLIWYLSCSKPGIFENVTGRNDLSGPAMIATALGLDSGGLMQLDPRPWSIASVLSYTVRTEGYINKFSDMTSFATWLDTVREVSAQIPTDTIRSRPVRIGTQVVHFQVPARHVDIQKAPKGQMLHYHVTLAYCLAPDEKLMKVRAAVAAFDISQMQEAIDLIINMVPEVQLASFPVPVLRDDESMIDKIDAMFGVA